jgi:TRAP-type mannitol/chloroaromatic compound transport system permease small subunit
MKILTGLAALIDGFNEKIGRGVSWLTMGLVLLVFADVIMRYLFNYSLVFIQELEWHVFATIFLLAGGYTLLNDQHVRVDLLYQRFNRKTRAWVNFLGVLFFLFPGCYLIIKVSIPWVMTAYEIGEISPNPGGIPARYLIKSILPIGFILLMLQGVSLAIHSLETLLKRPC